MIAAAVELSLEGNGIPLLQDIAERSGVSLRSLHRYFADGDAVLAEAYLSYVNNEPSPARVPTGLLVAPLAERVAWRVDERMDECLRTNAAFLALNTRARRSPRLQEIIEAHRQSQIEVVRRLFIPELARFDEPERAARVALAHTATMSESWDNLTRRHGLDDEQISATWTRTLLAALAPSGPAVP